MIFGWFGAKKDKKSMADLLEGAIVYQHVIGHIGKAKSLRGLGRNDEATEVFREGERLALRHLERDAQDKQAQMILAFLYCEEEAFERAQPALRRLLDSSEFELTTTERLVLSAELQQIERQRPVDQRSPEGPKDYTQIYCCAQCGRLHNFVSMPCPHCDWAPASLSETARSIVLSNAHLRVPALLSLAREMANGRSAQDVVRNLEAEAHSYLDSVHGRQAVERVFALLQQDEQKNHHSIAALRECSGCQSSILASDADACEECGEPVTWPDTIRALACLDNLLFLFEQRVEPSPHAAFSEFVCVLVAMTHNLLRKQEVPSPRERQYALRLLSEMKRLDDLGGGAVVDTTTPTALKIYLVKTRMREDSETMSLFLCKELQSFVAKMTGGVR